ncbi:hypothetical protein, partial [Nocardia cyriacigeorgica]|uniref:hypothetical protein n=1 Tax=Nocardia cyriacigeorgica TaxID=135487 RepID=UPI001BB264FF
MPRDEFEHRGPLNREVDHALTGDGTFTVGLITHPSTIAVPAACDQIRQVAEIFSESLGSDQPTNYPAGQP